MGDETSDPVLYSAVLRPHRSAGAQNVRVVVLAMAAVFFAVGGAFALAGAWPVMPFLGLEVLLLFAALQLNLRAGNALEAIALTESALTIRRVDHWGKETQVAFPPHWLQVNLEEPPDRMTPLELRSHGRSLVIGSFLLPNERLALARTLRRELDRLTRAQPAPART